MGKQRIKRIIGTVRTAARAAARMPRGDSGFSLVELLVAVIVFGVVAAAAYAMLNGMQEDAAYQSETQAVLDDALVVMQTAEKYLRQAGNDPLASGLAGIAVLGDREIRVRADLKGSLGASEPDKGDPDGDVDDADENVTLRFNPANRSFEVVSGGAAQLVGSRIHDLRFRCYDAEGNPTTDGERVRLVEVTVSGAADRPHPKTRKAFAVELQSKVRVSR